MTTAEQQEIIDPETGEIAAGPFELEPPLPDGEIPERVIAELRHTKRRAMDYTEAFADAVKAQAEKYGIKAGALRR